MRTTSVGSGAQGGDKNLPPFAVSACTTYHATFEQDLAAYRRAGVAGIGLWEYKIPPGHDDELFERFRASGLTATFCFPDVPGVIHGDVLFSEPKDRSQRLARLKSGIRRLAPFEPVAVACLAGPPRDVARSVARSWAVEGLREAAYVAGEVGVRLALEVVRPGPSGSLASTVPEALAIIADIGLHNVDVLIDTWHFWDSPQALADIRAYAERIAGVQVNDHAPDARGWWDRTLPGRGDIDLAGILRAIRSSGFAGWYELEIFSDDGTFGNVSEDSLWKWDPLDLVRAGRDGFAQTWRASFEG